jgi:hypothetical protein
MKAAGVPPQSGYLIAEIDPAVFGRYRGGWRTPDWEHSPCHGSVARWLAADRDFIHAAMWASLHPDRHVQESILESFIAEGCVNVELLFMRYPAENEPDARHEFLGYDVCEGGSTDYSVFNPVAWFLDGAPLLAEYLNAHGLAPTIEVATEAADLAARESPPGWDTWLIWEVYVASSPSGLK